MNISFFYIICGLFALVHCHSYGYDSYAEPTSAYNVNSYSLGSAPLDYAAPVYRTYSKAPLDYAAPTYQAYPKAAPRYSLQPLWSKELYPGRNSYKGYHSAPYYSQVSLPILPSAPLAKLYVPARQSYTAPTASYSSEY